MMQTIPSECCNECSGRKQRPNETKVASKKALNTKNLEAQRLAELLAREAGPRSMTSATIATAPLLDSTRSTRATPR